MTQNSLVAILQDQTKRALWEVNNVIDCVPDSLWAKTYCDMPMWKHIYHMLHSLDQWFINPHGSKFAEPPIHEKDLNNLDVVSSKSINKSEILEYFMSINEKTTQYLHDLTDDVLLEKPQNCKYTRFTLMIAQYRHLHCHLGMLMGFIISDLGKWPRVLGLEGDFPSENYDKFS